MDVYIARIEKESATQGLDSPSAVEQLGSATPIVEGEVAPMVGNAEVKTAELKELKKINKQLTQLINLKKQDNQMAALFYFSVIALGIVYVLIISR